MSNQSKNNWAARVRRAWIEHAAHSCGEIHRAKIITTFGISPAQASADIQAVMAEHPGCLDYDLRAKRYRWAGKKPKLSIPSPIQAFDFK